MTNAQLVPVNEDHADVALVHASKNGDLMAFEELVKRYDRRLLRIAQNVTHDFSDAQEVVQEVFLKAYQKLDQFREDARFSTWLVRITLNESFMKIRKQRATKEVLAEDLAVDMEATPSDVTSWVANPEALYSRTEMRDILGRALDELTPCTRIVFVLRDLEELSINETAEALNLTPNAVKARLSRARQQLRQKLSRYFAKNTESQQIPRSDIAPAAPRICGNHMAIAL